MTLQEAQKQVDDWIKTYGIRYFGELTNMAILTEEVGELARVISRTYGEQSFKKPVLTSLKLSKKIFKKKQNVTKHVIWKTIN